MIRQLRKLGYRIASPNPQPSQHKRSDFSTLGTITNPGNRVLLHYFFGRDSGGTKPATR
jgi:hypothetical protein